MKILNNTTIKNNKAYHAGDKPTPADIGSMDFRKVGSLTLTGEAPNVGGTNMFTITIPVPSASSCLMSFNLYIYSTWSYTNLSGSECYNVSFLASGASPNLQSKKIVPIYKAMQGNHFTFSDLRRDANGIHFDIHYSGNSNPIDIFTTKINGDSLYSSITMGNARRGNAGTMYTAYNSISKPSWNDILSKPSTFAPIIGTASNQAAAGNHNHTSLSSVTTINGGGSPGTYGSLDIGGSKNGWAGIRFTGAANTTLMVRASDGFMGMYRGNGSWIWAFNENGILTNGTVPWNSISGKPSSYYTHPNDANTRHVTDSEKNTWNGKAAGSHTHNLVLGEYTSGGTQTPANLGSNKLKLNMLNSATSGLGGWSDVLWMSSYAGGDVKLSNALVMSKVSARIGFKQANYDATSWGTTYEIYHTGKKPTASEIGAAPASHTHSYIPTSGQAYLGVTNGSSSTGHGLSLYNNYSGGQPSYGIMFAGIGTFGAHGLVSGDWATYLTMTGANNRGWIFKHGSGNGGNVASISSAGHLTTSGKIKCRGTFDCNEGLYIWQNGVDQSGGNYGEIQRKGDLVNFYNHGSKSEIRLWDSRDIKYFEHSTGLNWYLLKGSDIWCLKYASNSSKTYMHVESATYGAKGIDWWNSDLKLKGDIVPLNSIDSDFVQGIQKKQMSKKKTFKRMSALEVINSIEHFEYRLKEGNVVSSSNCGYIAQQLEEVNPDFVFHVEQNQFINGPDAEDGCPTKIINPCYDENDPVIRNPRPSAIIPYLTKAIQEQQALINELQVKVSTIDDLQQKVEMLMTML